MRKSGPLSLLRLTCNDKVPLVAGLIIMSCPLMLLCVILPRVRLGTAWHPAQIPSPFVLIFSMLVCIGD